MATRSSVLAWRIPGTVEPDGLPSMGLHRVGHDWSDLAAAAAVLNVTRTQEKYSKSTFSELWKLTSLSTIQELCFQEKWLNLSKNHELYGILTCSLPSSVVALKTNSYTIMVLVKTGNLAATGGGKIGLKVPHKALFLENCNYYLSCLAAFWKFPHAELDFIWPDSGLTQCEQSFPSGIKKESLVKESSGGGTNDMFGGVFVYVFIY